MEIGLIRVDSRLIHGQLITKWLNYSKANVIVVVDDELSKDSFMSEIYKAICSQWNYCRNFKH